MATPLILKRAPIGDNQEDYDVLEDGVVVGRIFLVPVAPAGRPWMWASGHGSHIERAAHGYEATREDCDGGVRQELVAAISPSNVREASSELVASEANREHSQRDPGGALKKKHPCAPSTSRPG